MAKIFFYLLILLMLIIPTANASVVGLNNVVIQNDPIFGSGVNPSGKVWLVNLIANGATDVIVAYNTPQTLTSLDGTKSQQAFNVKVTDTSSYAKYGIVDAINECKYSDPTYCFSPHYLREISNHWYVLITDSWDVQRRWAKDNCADTTFDGAKDWAEYDSFQNQGLPSVFVDRWVYCYTWTNKIGDVKGVQHTRDIFNTNFVVDVVGKDSSTASFSNDADPNTGQLTNTVSKIGNYVQVNWQGNLQTGNVAPDTSNVRMLVTSFSPTAWKIIDVRPFYDWSSWMSGSSPTCIQQEANLLKGAQPDGRCANIAKSNIDRMNTWTSDSRFTQTKVVALSGTDFKIDIPIAFPNYLLYVAASYLEIKIPVGIPNILNVLSQQFDENGVGYISATFQNIGTDRGSFEYNVYGCTNGVSSSGSTQIVTLDSQQTTTVQIPISGSSTSSNAIISGTCQVSLKERTSLQVATAQVSVSFKQTTNCDPNKTIPDFTNNQILKCSSDGMTQTVIQKCSSTQVPIYNTATGVWECKADGEGGNKCGDGLCDLGEQILCPADCDGGGNSGCAGEGKNPSLFTDGCCEGLVVKEKDGLLGKELYCTSVGGAIPDISQYLPYIVLISAIIIVVIYIVTISRKKR